MKSYSTNNNAIIEAPSSISTDQTEHPSTLPDRPFLFDSDHTFLPDALLTPEQTADVLKVKLGTLSVWRSTGRYGLKYVKCGRWVRYRWKDVLTFIESRTQSQVS